jgi:transposase-like protein
MSRQSKFSTEDKLAIVMVTIKGEESTSSIARRHGVSETAIYRWREQFLEGARHGLAGNSKKNGRAAQLEKDLAERDRVIGELTVANRILKKTLK